MAFYALPIPEDIRSNLVDGLAALRQQFPRVQWVHPDDYHLTLRFIGGLQAEARDRLLAAVQGRTLPFTPFTLQLRGLDSFPPRRDRGVLWVGLENATPPLLDLQQRLEEHVQALGFEPERRLFTPHLTVGRFHASDARGIQEALPTFADRNWGALTSEEYVLMKRRSGAREGSSTAVYEVLARFPE